MGVGALGLVQASIKVFATFSDGPYATVKIVFRRRDWKHERRRFNFNKKNYLSRTIISNIFYICSPTLLHRRHYYPEFFLEFATGRTSFWVVNL